MPLELNGFTGPVMLYASTRTLVRRAVRVDDQTPVIIRSLIVDHPSASELARFRFACDIQKRFDHPGIVKVLDVLEFAGAPILVMEDIGGITLQEYMTQFAEQRIPLEQFLALAIQLVQGLGEIHRNQVIHKDLHPGNIIVTPDGARAQITDFDISTLLSREQPEQQPAEALEGILGFISPEQTGRMNRALDYRTDFYSLGVTFYWMLAGQMPFDVQGGIAMVHAHIARVPQPVNEVRADLPLMIARIIDKLMAKNAEARYQSAAGLQFDLELCAQQWNASRVIVPFVPGQHDVSEQFQISQKLYGREKDIERLLLAFRLAQQGQPQLLAVAGYPGIGKSALVHEAHKPIAAHGGWFIAGKFDQFSYNIPYSALHSALRTWLQLILAEGSTSLMARRRRLREVLGANARVLVDFHPDMSLLLGELPAVPVLGALETQNRLYRILQLFIQEMTREHSLVLFLDDLQWADPGTLGLLKVLMSESGARLLLIVAYRDNEVSESDPALMTLRNIQLELRTHGERYHALTLAPLSKPDIVRLLIDTLHSTDGVDVLAQLVHEKTAGNPFFINEFLKTLYSEQLINFDGRLQRWMWDVQRIRQQAITDNVVELMLAKMQRLPANTQRCMQLAACVGSRFELSVLARVDNVSVQQLSSVLWPALKEGLILLEGGNWLHEPGQTGAVVSRKDNDGSGNEPACRFLHDRMRQAAHESMSVAERQQTHLAIGRILQQRQSADAGLDVFTIAEHLNEASTLIVAADERVTLAELNLRAARMAKASSAWAAAARHTRVARELLPGQAWQSRYELTAAVYSLGVECEILDSQFDAAEQLADVALANLGSPHEKARICFLLLNSNIVRGKREYALKMGVEGLRHCGIAIPGPDQLEAHLQMEKSLLAEMAATSSLAHRIRLVRDAEPITALAASLLSALFLASFVAGNRTLNTFIACKSMRLLLDEGLSDVTAALMGQYAGMLIWQQEYAASFELALMATNFADSTENKSNCLQIYLFSGSGIWFHFRPFQEAIEILWRGVHAGFEYGDVAMGMGCLSNIPIVRFAKGDPLQDVADNVGQLTELMTRYKLQVSAGRHYWRLLHMLQTADGQDLLQDAAFSEQELQIIRNSTLQAFVQHLRLQWLFWSEQFEAGLTQLPVAETALARIPGLGPTVDHPLLKALLLSVNVAPGHAASVITELQSLEAHYLRCTQMCEDNFSHKLSLVRAQIARLQGSVEATINHYRAAIQTARQHGFLQFEALGQEWLGRYLDQLGWREFAAHALREAHYLYGRWGCLVKQHLLEQQFAEVFDVPVDSGQRLGTDGFRSTVTGSSGLRASTQLDLESIMKATQVISSELILERLLKKILHIIIENAGAQSAALVVEREGSLQLEARLLVDRPGQGSGEFVSQPAALTDSSVLPLDMLRYVLLTDKTLLIQDVASNEAWSRDIYVRTALPQSILCIPMHYRDSLTGVLYLENTLVTNAFSDDRLQVLQLLLVQASISLENARLFDEVQVLNASLEHKVEQRTAELRAVNKELEAFSYSVSHDLRGPLRNINGFSKMLLDQHSQSLSEQGRDLLQRVCRNTDKMSNLIGGLLALSKLTRSELTIAEVNLAELARTIAEELLAQYPEQPVDWHCAPAVWVRGDQRLLYSMLENLLNNAWKYSARTPQPRIEFGVQHNADRTVYFVRDNGAGFDMRYADRLFASFQRLHNDKDFSGTGIGLATVQRIVQRHGGEVWAEAEVNKGATFYFTLGLQDESPS